MNYGDNNINNKISFDPNPNLINNFDMNNKNFNNIYLDKNNNNIIQQNIKIDNSNNFIDAKTNKGDIDKNQININYNENNLTNKNYINTNNNEIGDKYIESIKTSLSKEQLQEQVLKYLKNQQNLEKIIFLTSQNKIKNDDKQSQNNMNNKKI